MHPLEARTSAVALWWATIAALCLGALLTLVGIPSIWFYIVGLILTVRTTTRALRSADHAPIVSSEMATGPRAPQPQSQPRPQPQPASKNIRRDLRGRDLRDRDLHGEHLDDADLTGANLSGANLTGAHLNDANLNDADLSRADLSGADLSRADLSGAYLLGAVWTYQTSWPPADFEVIDDASVSISPSAFRIVKPPKARSEARARA